MKKVTILYRPYYRKRAGLHPDDPGTISGKVVMKFMTDKADIAEDWSRGTSVSLFYSANTLHLPLLSAAICNGNRLGWNLSDSTRFRCWYKKGLRLRRRVLGRYQIPSGDVTWLRKHVRPINVGFMNTIQITVGLEQSSHIFIGHTMGQCYPKC